MAAPSLNRKPVCACETYLTWKGRYWGLPAGQHRGLECGPPAPIAK